jgi:hypothetical protein
MDFSLLLTIVKGNALKLKQRCNHTFKLEEGAGKGFSNKALFYALFYLGWGKAIVT